MKLHEQLKMDALHVLVSTYGVSLHKLLKHVSFHEGPLPRGLPAGLTDVLKDPIYGPQVTPELIRVLCRTQLPAKAPRP